MPGNAMRRLVLPHSNLSGSIPSAHDIRDLRRGLLFLGHQDPAVWVGWTGLLMVGWDCKIHCGT